MAVELQPLIDQIQKEAVDKADQQAAEILAKARARAEQLVKEADEQARRGLEKADRDARAFAERSARTLEQAARDVLISVEKGVQDIVSRLAAEEMDKHLQGAELEALLTRLIEAYAARAGADSGIEILLNPRDQQSLVQVFKDRYRNKLAGGVEIKADAGIQKGFVVSFNKGRVYHDFTRESMAEALAGFLRPHLAGLVRQAAQKDPPGK